MSLDWVSGTLRSPLSKKNITLSKEGILQTEDGDEKFLLFNDVPWVFKNSFERLFDWQAQIISMLADLETRTISLQSLSFESANKNTLRRLSLLKEAYSENKLQFEKILSPFLSTKPSNNPLVDKLPSTQNINSYIKNIFRDWSWGESEIEATINQVKKMIGKHKLGDNLVIGAGSCRYSLEMSLLGSSSVTSIDINPLLLSIGKQIISGKELEIFEIADAPISLEDTAQKILLKSPVSTPKNPMNFVFGDGINAPFKNSSFDSVLTPWFIDIVSEPMNQLALRINRLIKDKGLWINFGPLSFGQQKLINPQSIEEIEDILADSGFAIISSEVIKLPYLQSPIDGGSRNESVYFFVAQKTTSKRELKDSSNWPEWILKPDSSIEKNPLFEELKVKTHVHTQILSSIDGQTSINDLTQALASSYGLESNDAKSSLINFFSILYEQNRNRFK